MTFHHQSTRPNTDTTTSTESQPEARRPVPSSPGVPTPRESSTESSTEHLRVSAPEVAPSGASLTTSKVLAGGMASATSAVLGSYFGVFGTVGGAAAGSVATMVSTTIYERSIERTSSSLRARVGRAPPSRPTKAPTATHPRPPRLLIATLIGTIAIFALGIGLVTGIEWIKGGPLSGGGHGTSVSQVLRPSSSSRPSDQSDHGAPHNSRPRSDSDSTQPRVPRVPAGPGGLLPSAPQDPGDSSRRDEPSQPQVPGGLGEVLPQTG
jgi:hypothetical protein